MPFKSEAQARYLYLHHPTIAKRWQAHTPKGADLPEHVKREKSAAFKVGFLRRLAAAGLDPDRLYGLVKTAFFGEDALNTAAGETWNLGKAGLGSASGLLGSGLKTLGGGALLAPAVLGGATGVVSGMLNSPIAADSEVLRKHELLQLYERLTSEIRARRHNQQAGGR
jgi:hypothetical protein